MSSKLCQDIVLNFFVKIIKQDIETLNRINLLNTELYFDTETNYLVFSLPALHQFLNDQLQLSYLEFRKIIYQSSINTDLSQSAAKIEVHQSSYKVNTSLYVLSRA
ncbi:hypothetical protein MNBD_GAMMA22-169 [hydrothermal vent metagenome]|uniref:Uncharacterized protein n=1 Tax=hydrothermal vent metagenome TaxID=652676 RepID=A0A3B1B6C1_9ZZZZ